MAALYTVPQTSHRRFRSNFVYRGVASKAWRLETSLKRLGPHCAEVERPLLRSFAKYAQPGEVPSDKLWFRLATAQHHGLPTRLLDWSVSPKVAVHFATAEEEHYDEDGAIWCADVAAARQLLPPQLRNLLQQEWAFIFSHRDVGEDHQPEGIRRAGKRRKVRVVFRAAVPGRVNCQPSRNHVGHAGSHAGPEDVLGATPRAVSSDHHSKAVEVGGPRQARPRQRNRADALPQS